MKNYVKPSMAMVSDVAEGVYMASGAGFGDGNSSTDCWNVGANSVQDWNGSHHVFEAWANHSTAAVHITDNVVYTFTFSSPVVDAYSEFACTFSGNTVIVTRDLHANGYKSGDNVTFKVWVKCADEATTKAVACSGVAHKCTHKVNVQGGID